jgi:hypothetical protein
MRNLIQFSVLLVPESLTPKSRLETSNLPGPPVVDIPPDTILAAIPRPANAKSDFVLITNKTERWRIRQNSGRPSSTCAKEIELLGRRKPKINGSSRSEKERK